MPEGQTAAAAALPYPIDDLKQHSYWEFGQRRDPPLKGGWDTPEPYYASTELRNAVNLALYLRRPLLLEGEPGTGKTRLARAVAYELGRPLYEIHVGSASRARELLYTYDALGRLYDIQDRQGFTRDHYVIPGKLGMAIESAERGVPSVVLIDEIDKADVDFPNDLLLVLDEMRYSIPEVSTEAGHDVLEALKKANKRLKTLDDCREYLPLVIITSNREKELPGPFLRRCLYYFVPFPKRESSELTSILLQHFTEAELEYFEEALRRFWELRDETKMSWRKKPGTSELIDWLKALRHAREQDLPEAERARTAELSDLPYKEALVKTQSDREALGNIRQTVT